jgi:hypothetical protein
VSHYIVQTAAARMPSTCKGKYRRVAVLEVRDGVQRASMISDRSKDVIRVVATWERRNVGLTSRCAYERAKAAARAIVAEENATAALMEFVTALRFERDAG